MPVLSFRFHIAAPQQHSPIPLDAISAGTGGRRAQLIGYDAFAADRLLRVAFAGRTSTDDLQDPVTSLLRQLSNSQAALPPGGAMVAYFYDVESGRKALDARGHGRGHERFNIPIPRDGGIQDLLAEARQPDRRFDAVICEDIARIGRRSHVSQEIETLLERAGVLLIAADEPLITSGKRATQPLTRRVKQGVSEWYVLELLEKSWDGLSTHSHMGYNIGKPPYGYLKHDVPHPIASRREQGATKHTSRPTR